MIKQKFKRVIALFLCLIILLPSISHLLPLIVSFFPIHTVYADNYEENDSDDESGITYYTVNDKDIDDLFNFTLSTALGGQDLIDWFWSFRTFTVIGAVDTGEYYLYFNTPNLQSLAKNQVTKAINDGYTEDTYDVNETEWLVDVGKYTVGSEFSYKEENVISKYGFQIPSYTYMGEYPKVTMTVAGIVPQSFFGKLWKGIKALFGASFIDAPDASNFNTITYHNHGYKDKNEWLVRFFQKYYYKYFVSRIATDASEEESYFINAKNLIDETVTEEAKNNAENWLNENSEELLKLHLLESMYNEYVAEGTSTMDIELYPGHTVSVTVHNYMINPDSEFLSYFFEDPDRSDDYIKAYNSWVNGPYTKYVIKKPDYKRSGVSDLKAFASGNKIKYKDKKTKKYVTVSASKYNSSKGTLPQMSYNGSSYLNISRWDNLLKSAVTLCTYNLQRSNFLTEQDEAMLKKEADCKNTIARYEAFIKKFDVGKELSVLGSNPRIYYKQCLIKSDEDEQCYSKKFGGNKTTLSVAQLYAYSGLYKVLGENRFDGTKSTELTEEEAQVVLKKIQAYCGPYYEEVIGNVIKLMWKIIFVEQDNEAFQMLFSNMNDPRIMPYDVDTLTPADKSNYNVRDPRVELYKDHFIGKLVSDIELSGGFLLYIKPQKTIINLGGKITELAILFQRLCSFDQLDKWGLSPVNMWTSAWVALLMGLVALYFICTTVSCIVKMGSKGAYKVIIGFLVLFLELGVLAALLYNPEKTWKNIKDIQSKVMNLGEAVSPLYNSEGLDYLYSGVSNQEVTYYLPYLDMWSKYNTGYGILADEQKIDLSANLPETKEYEAPQINGKDIQHYSILLMDSFSYYGDSNSFSTSVNVGTDTKPKMVNGTVINNNAYRVVDHFLAPRVLITQRSATELSMSINDNENYNGKFQSGIFDLLVKLLNCLLAAFLSLIKLLVFLWQWYVFYIFIFRVVLGKLAEHKNWKDIIIETFGPTFCLILFGTYSALAIWLGMTLEGLVGLFTLLFLFWFTFKLIYIWKGVRMGTLFPHTLKPIVLMMDAIEAKVKHKHNKQTENLHEEDMALSAVEAGEEIGFELTEDDAKNLNTFTDKLFEENGDMKSHDSQLYDAWWEKVNYELKQKYNNKLEDMDENIQKAYLYYQNNGTDKGRMQQTLARVNDRMKHKTFKKYQHKQNELTNKNQNDKNPFEHLTKDKTKDSTEKDKSTTEKPKK